MSFPLHLQRFAVDHCLVEFFVPDTGAVKGAFQKGEIAFPYWSQVWPSAKALATFLVKNSSFSQGKKVLELGAGLGLPSLVAARNASQVLCTDYVPEAVDIASRSAAHAGLQNFTASVLNWQHLPPETKADVLLLSDINYEPSAFVLLLNMVNTFLFKGTTVLLSTPQRLLAKEFIAPLLAYCEQQEEVVVLHEGNEVAITVLVLGRRDFVSSN